MKKLTLIIVGLIVALTLQAQSKEHMKFMGIPLNGTINQFQQKLQKKGIRYDAKGSKNIQAGCKAFKGTFSGEEADFYVYFDVKTKKVYRAKAVIECINKERGKSKLLEYKEKLSSKYPNSVSHEGQQDGYPTFSLYLPNSEREYLGCINLYITDMGYSFIDEVYLHIDYYDGPNEKEREMQNFDDL